MMARSFGLLSDRVEGFDIVLADGCHARHVTVWKPNSEFVCPCADQLICGNDDLFWAVMGGSPGNFGILTHVRLQPLHDKDYPDSRMIKFVTNYTPEKHQAVTAVLAEMTGDEDFPRNYHYALTLVGPARPEFEGKKTFNLKECKGEKLNEDEEMMHKYGEQYADGVEWAEQGQGSIYYLMDGMIPPSTLNV